MSAPEPLVIRGKRYASHREAAKLLGVSRNTIARRLDEGTIDTVGMKMSVDVAGELFESVSAAALKLKVSEATVYCAISRRTTGTLGSGSGNRTNHGRNVKPVTYGGFSWPSRQAMAEDIGWTIQRLRSALNNPTRLKSERLMGAVVRAKHEKLRGEYKKEQKKLEAYLLSEGETDVD